MGASGGSEIAAEAAWRELSRRPGFLIRRLHQIHVALFAEACARFNVTPVQYSVLTVAALRPGLDQASLGHEAGVDRTTLADVLGRLERRGLILRAPSPTDRRVRLVSATAAGLGLLAELDAPARHAHERTVAPLGPVERQAFLDALARLVDANNAYGRAPMRLG